MSHPSGRRGACPGRSSGSSHRSNGRSRRSHRRDRAVARRAVVDPVGQRSGAREVRSRSGEALRIRQGVHPGGIDRTVSPGSSTPLALELPPSRHGGRRSWTTASRGRRDPADLVAVDSVNQRLPSGPAVMPQARCRQWDRELGDDAGRRDPADLVAVVLGEPEVAVRAGRDVRRAAAGRRDAGNSVMTPAVVIRPIWSGRVLR